MQRLGINLLKICSQGVFSSDIDKLGGVLLSDKDPLVTHRVSLFALVVNKIRAKKPSLE